MKQKLSLRRLAKLLLFVGALALVFSCSTFDETESVISGADKIACQQFSDSSFFEMSLVELTEFDTTWVNAQVSSNVPAIIDTLVANGLVVQAGLDSAYHIMRAGDSSYVALESDISKVTVFYTDVLDLNVYDASGTLIDFSSDKMPLETISGCRDEDDETYEGNVIKVRLEYDLTGNKFLLQFMKTENTGSSEIYLTIQNSN